jgi:PEP-CTERM motif
MRTLGDRIIKGLRVTTAPASTTLRLTPWAAALLLALFVPSAARACVILSGVLLTIDDSGQNLIGTCGFGEAICATIDPSTLIDPNTGNPAQWTITQETAGAAGKAEITFQYQSIDPNAPGVGLTSTFGIDILEPGSSFVSDTLDVSMTGAAGAAAGLLNVTVLFFSDSLAEVPPAPVDTPTVVETGQFQTFNPLTDLTINVASDAPEPSSLALFGTGLLALFGLLRRCRNADQRASFGPLHSGSRGRRLCPPNLYLR